MIRQEKFDISMYDFFKQATATDPKNNKLWEFWGASITRDKFIKDVENFAGYLISLGIKKGDNIILCLSNIPDAIVSFYAINRTGAIANVVHPLLPSQKLKEMSEDMDTKAFILFDEFYSNYKDWIEDTKKPVILCGASDYLPKLFKPAYNMYASTLIDKDLPKQVVKYRNIGKYMAPSVNIKGSDIAVYMHSGGTSGKSKVVMLDNQAFNHLTDNIASIVDYKADNKDAMLMALPIFHTYGLGICMHTMMCTGVRIILMPKFKAKTACYLVKRYKITMISGVPNMFDKMLKTGMFKGNMLKRLRACYCGGDKVSDNTKIMFANTMKAAGNNIKISEGYGLTEACVCCINTMQVYKPNSIGRPIKNMTFKIVDENNEELQPFTKGEIIISGNTLMTGYYNNGEDPFFYDENNIKWLKTGDIGYMDYDGNVYYTDRKKRLIKIAGVNVFPQEIENVVDSLDFVKCSCVVETQINNKIAIKLFVVKQDNTVLSNTEIRKAIKSEIGNRLMKYSMPSIIEFIEKLPLTSIGKVDYLTLQKMTK